MSVFTSGVTDFEAEYKQFLCGQGDGKNYDDRKLWAPLDVDPVELPPSLFEALSLRVEVLGHNIPTQTLEQWNPTEGVSVDWHCGEQQAEFMWMGDYVARTGDSKGEQIDDADRAQLDTFKAVHKALMTRPDKAELDDFAMLTLDNVAPLFGRDNTIDLQAAPATMPTARENARI